MRRSLTIIFSLFFAISIEAQSLLDSSISIDARDQTIGSILDSLADDLNFSFAYDKRKIPLRKKVSISAKDIPLRVALTKIFVDTGVEYAVAGSQISLFRKEIQLYTLSGYVRDRASAEALIGANVYEQQNFKGVASNDFGFYSLTLPAGPHVIKASFVGYQSLKDTIDLLDDIQLNFELEPGNDLNEVIIVGKTGLVQEETALWNSKTQAEQLDVANTKNLPTLFGEKDLMKYIQLLPGVSSGGIAGNALHIRGGSADQNLILLDDIPLYNISHLYGLISVFNGNAINSAKLYKSAFPARYGGRLSSILDVRMKDGNKREYHGGLSVGLLSASFFVEGPVQKEKSSFILSARRSWLDAILNPIQTDRVNKGLQSNFDSYRFYDVNFKSNFTLSDKDRLFLSVYSGDDKSTTENQDSVLLNVDFPPQPNISRQILQWKNNAFALRWNRIINSRLFMNTSLIQSNFKYRLQNTNDIEFFQADNKINVNSDLLAESFIKEYSLKSDFSFIPSPKQYLRFGMAYSFRQSNPVDFINEVYVNENLNEQEDFVDKVESNELALYIEDEIKVDDQIDLNLGFRLSSLLVNETRYTLPQLRARINFSPNLKNTFSFSYSDMAQLIHMITNSGLGLESEMWVPSTDKIKPQKAYQLAFSHIVKIENNWQFKWALYFKELDRIIRFQLGANLFNTVDQWEQSIISGSGQAYGAEFILNKLRGKTQGWLSYSLGRSFRSFPDLNDGIEFSYKFDRRHILNLSLNHELSSKPRQEKKLALVWSYASGFLTTIPEQWYTDPEGNLIPQYESINNYKMPDFHRLDISYNSQKTNEKGNSHIWRYGIFNVYGRINPFNAKVIFDFDSNTFKLNSQSISTYPIPFVTYEFLF